MYPSNAHFPTDLKVFFRAPFSASPFLCLLQIFFVSDFFKPPVDANKKVDIPHTTLQETPTNGNHFESQLS